MAVASGNPAEAATRDHDLAVAPLLPLANGDFARNVQRMIVVRFAAGFGVFAATVICVYWLRLPLPETWLYSIGLFILLFNIALYELTRRARTQPEPAQTQVITRLVVAQVAVDWAATALFIHLTGGISSPAIVLFLIHMMMVAILLPGQSPYIYAALGVGATLVIALLERAGIIPHYTVIPALPDALHLDPVFILAQLTFLALIGFITVYLTATTMKLLRERERQIATLLRTTQVVSSSLSLDEVMESLTRSVAQALDAPAASLRLFDSSGERLEMAVAHGLSQDYLDKGPIRVSQSPLDQHVMNQPWVIIDDVSRDGRLQYRDEVLAEGIHSMLVVPVAGRQRVLGVLRVYAYQPGAFDEKRAEFVRAIAQQGALGLENALAHDALKQADQQRSEFVRVATHELRSPVAGAQSLIRAMLHSLAGDMTEDQRDITRRIEARLDALRNLVDDLLDLAASQTDISITPSVELHLDRILQNLMSEWSTQAAEKQITLEMNLPTASQVVVCGVETDLIRIFDNLIGNAIKYTPPGGRVAIDLAAGPVWVSTRVADSGIGIPEDELPRLMTEFFRASNARHANIPGTGLGLSIVRRLVTRHRGTIDVQSVPGQGTTFTVRLPYSCGESTAATGS
ncbi:MAG: GAF domain-containing protein [Anaerolineae bacterium]|nr:GAF domain-containing protein [Anaerolineae bacterium]